MDKELQNALAWFKAAPQRWYNGVTERAAAAAEWIWVVIQGDFAEEQSTAQVVTGTVISMIPLVDQICDVRDIVANCKKINEDTSNKWAWVALVLTLIGLFPTLGSLVKGCFKILFAYGRKAMLHAGKAALDADMWKAVSPYMEAGIRKLNDFLARPEVRGTLSRLRIDNPYQYLSTQVRELAAKVNTGSLISAFDKRLEDFKSLMSHVQRWGGEALATKAGQLIQTVNGVRRQANSKLEEVLQPVQHLLDRTAKRLELEHAHTYRAATNVTTPHNFSKLSFDAEVTALKKAPPEWVRVGTSGLHLAAQKAPQVPPGHFDIGSASTAPGCADAFETFTADVRPDRLPAGSKIYRVLDPKSADNSICWMTEVEFKKLRSKQDWRDRFAVWGNWNSNGEYVTYTVPTGGLPVWRGTTASQQLKDRAGNVVQADAKGNSFWIDGGAEQLVINPRDLQRANVSPRKFTYWDDGRADIEVALIGVPTLTSWRDWK
jgi:hypothetical protein